MEKIPGVSILFRPGVVGLLNCNGVFFHQIMKIAALQADAPGGLGHVPVAFYQGISQYSTANLRSA